MPMSVQREIRDTERVELPTSQTASLTIQPSEYGFAVVWSLDGEEPTVLLQRQDEQKAAAQHRLNTKFLVDAHGWEVVGVDGSTTYFKRPRPLDADEPDR